MNTLKELKDAALDAMHAHGCYGFVADAEHGLCCHAETRGGRPRVQFDTYPGNDSLTAKQAATKYKRVTA